MGRTDQRRERVGDYISAKYFSWRFLCKQGLNRCLRIVEKKMSLAIVLELQEVQENDEVTYSTEVISRHKKENRTFIPSHTFWDLQQRN